MQRARAELGPDALLLNMRDAPPEALHLGTCEVVFGLQPPARNEAAPPTPNSGSLSDLRRTVEELKDVVVKIGSAVDRDGGLAALRQIVPELSAQITTDIDAAVRQRLVI